MAEFVKYTSGFNVGGENIGLEAAKVQWPAISGITATSGITGDQGVEKIMPADQVLALVNDRVTGAYKIRGTKTVESINGMSDMVIGDVYNVADDGTINNGFGGTPVVVKAGDNVVWTNDIGWDKLAATISLEGYATEEWVTDNFVANDRVVDSYDESTETSAVPTVGAVIDAIDANKITSYYNQVKVQTEGGWVTTSAEEADIIGFKAGSDNVVLGAAADEYGNPVISISVNADEAPSAAGANGVYASLVEEGGVKSYAVSGIDATTAKAGVTKAAYYNEETGLIHLF